MPYLSHLESIRLEDFRAFLLSTSRSENTATTYVYNVRQFLLWCGERGFRPLTPATDASHRAFVEWVRMWLADQLERKAGNTVRPQLAAVKALGVFIKKTLPKDLNVKRERVAPTLPLAPWEVTRLYDAACTERDALILMTFLTTGMRVAEVAAMDGKDIRYDMVVIRGKGGKERWVRPPQDVMSKLQRFARPGPIWLTQAGEALKKHQIRKLIYRLAARAGLDDVHPHRFRATFAVNFYEATKDIQALKDILGHESIATTERYIEYTKRQRSLQLMADLQWSAWTSPGRPCACGCGRMVTGKASRNYFDSGCRTKATRARQKEVAVRSQELSRSA